MAIPDGTIKWITTKFGTYDMTCVNNIFVRYKHHDSSPDKRFSTLEISKADGLKLISSNYGVKEIEVTGSIVETSYALLNDKIDEMKEHLAEENGILQIGLGNDRVRNYYCTPDKPITIEDDFGNIIGQEWKVTFVCYDPFGYGTSTTTHGSSGCNMYHSDTIDIDGTAPAVPDIVLTPEYEIASVIEFTNVTTNEKLTITGTFDIGNDITISTDDSTVMYGGVEAAHTGVFPTWPTGWNTYTIGLPSATAGCVDISISYVPRYL